MFSSVMSHAFIAFCLTTTILFISTPAFCQVITDYVNCTNRKNDDKLLFLQQNYLSTTMYHCKEGFLKQKGCYIGRAVSDKKCVTLTAFKADDHLTNPVYRLYDDRTDQILCDNYANNGVVQAYVHPRIAEKCHRDGQTKYNEFGGHPLCSTKNVQVYQFGERAWKKCDENGQFIVQNCITNTPKRCITKTYWDERIENAPYHVAEDIRNSNLPFCEAIKKNFEELDHFNHFIECDFNSPFIVNRPIPPAEAGSTQPVPTTTEIELIEKEDELPPKEQCLHGALNDVWYENDVPLKCQILLKDEKTCIDYQKLRKNLTYYRNMGNPIIWQQNWDNSKAGLLLNHTNTYMGYNYDLQASINTLFEGPPQDFRSALENIERAFTPEELNDRFINEPYFFCQLVHNFLPIKHQYLLYHSEGCPSSGYVKDNCIKKDHTRVPMGYPKIMHNVYYNKEKMPVKCYVKQANPSCISFNNAQRLLGYVEPIIIHPQSGYDRKKDNILQERLKLDAKRRGKNSWNILSFKQRIERGDHIVEIMENSLKKLVNFEGEVEREFVVNGQRIKMGPATFCAIIGDLIPIKFDDGNVNRDLEKCDFDAPVYMTVPVPLPEAATLTPSTSVAIPTKPETTTTEIQTTTEEDELPPGDKCLHGALNDVWYENDVPLKCQILWYDEKTCINYDKLRYNLTFYRNVHTPDLKIWQRYWDKHKENMLKKYDDINKDYKDNENYGLHDSIKTLKGSDRWNFRSAVTNIEIAFTPEHTLWLNDEFINEPYFFCQLVHNFLPIKHDYLLEHSEDCPSSSYVENHCIRTNDRNIMGYPKIMHNVYYNEEKKPTKCYVKEAYPSCINFDNAQRLLGNLETKIRSSKQGYSYKKDDLLKARIKLDAERRNTDSSQISSLKQRMNDGDDIWEIIEYNFKQLVNFEREVEREFVVDGRRIKMGPATFCAIIGELIPVDFSNENLTEYLEDCKPTFK